LLPASALIAAVGIAALAHEHSRTSRLATLDLANEALPDTYIVRDRSRPDRTDRCWVTGRRGATVRRDEKGPGTGVKWDCHRLLAERALGQHTWLIRAKSAGTGAQFLVPVSDVPDWTFPFLYAVVRERVPDLELPWVGWTQLFVERIYQGLYLRVALPFDLRKREGGTGLRRELLSIRSGALGVVDSRFLDADRFYVEWARQGRLPELTPPSPALAWLAKRRATGDVTLVTAAHPATGVSLLPLPVSLLDLYRVTYDREATFHADGDYRQWTHGAWREEDGAVSVPDDDELETEFADYAEFFLKALRVDAHAHERLPTARVELAARQLAIEGLGLERMEL
jgi:hypothetical protein